MDAPGDRPNAANPIQGAIAMRSIYRSDGCKYSHPIHGNFQRFQLGANCHKAPSGAPRLGDLPDVCTLKVDLDTGRLSAFGLTTGDVNNTLATAWGGRYVDHFIDKGRIKRVYTCRRLLCSHFTTLHRTLIGLMPLAAMEDAPPWLLSGGSPGARI